MPLSNDTSNLHSTTPEILCINVVRQVAFYGKMRMKEILATIEGCNIKLKSNLRNNSVMRTTQKIFNRKFKLHLSFSYIFVRFLAYCENPSAGGNDTEAMNSFCSVHAVLLMQRCSWGNGFGTVCARCYWSFTLMWKTNLIWTSPNGIL